LTHKKLPVVSIITIVKDGEAVLERTIRSVLSQTYPAIEYIIVFDNKTQDHTLDIIRRYEHRLSRWISTTPQRKISTYDSMNKGLRVARGTYVWFMNAGDEFHDRHTVSNVFAADSNADVYYGETVLTNMEGNIVGAYKRRAPEHLKWKHFLRNVVCHQAFVIKRSLVGPYDLRYSISADIDWMIRGLKKSKKIVNTHAVLAKFLVGGLSTQRKLTAMFEYFHITNKHFGMRTTLLKNMVLVPELLVECLFDKTARA